MFRSQFAEDRFVAAFERMAEMLEKIALQAAPVERVKSFNDIRQLMREGQKIEAIKLFRLLTGAGLKDAKDQVESIKDIY